MRDLSPHPVPNPNQKLIKYKLSPESGKKMLTNPVEIFLEMYRTIMPQSSVNYLSFRQSQFEKEREETMRNAVLI